MLILGAFFLYLDPPVVMTHLRHYPAWAPILMVLFYLLSYLTRMVKWALILDLSPRAFAPVYALPAIDRGRLSWSGFTMSDQYRPA